ncbi:MAG TPA: DUF4199 domain-containing protein [Pyrinomonadaceae bacterium]|jgi:hypothetical protein|nr:DUF4199 domain-containing protein [Pyrinomonadaceae bacterium]
MKKTVLIFGLISGALMAIFMTGTMIYVRNVNFDRGMILGYAGMVLAFLLVFFGIRSYRENIGGGRISFGRAFSVGILIMLISSACYVVAWEVVYFKVMHEPMHDFIEKYGLHEVDKVRKSGASEQEIQAKLQEMKWMRDHYDNVFFNAALTLLEPLPPGLIMTLISAAILRKKRKVDQSTAGVTATMPAS